MSKHNPLIHKVITIDGPSVSGKGTLAKRLSKRYRMKYLDTGTLYRAVVYAVLQKGIDLTDTPAVAQVARDLDFDFRHVGQNNFETFLNGKSVEAGIRTPEVEAGIPLTAPEPLVREALRARQVDFVHAWKDMYGVILDGRDTGARIYPEADIKFFIVGDVKIRAQRRHAQWVEQGILVDIEKVEADLKVRDERDAPNTLQTEDAHVLDVTHKNADEIEAAACKIIETTIGKAAA